MHIESQNIILRPIEHSDTPDIIRWRNNPQVKCNFVYQEALTEAAHTHWLSGPVAEGRAVQFIIIEKASMQAIGSVYLRDIDYMNRKAEYGIFIGEDAARGKGIGRECARLVLDYAFKTLDLHRVFLRAFADNEAALRSYQNAGFVVEGCFRDDVCIDGKFRDMVFMACIAPIGEI